MPRSIDAWTMEKTRHRLLAFIFPNTPGSPMELEALEEAAFCQAEYELEKAEAMGGIPEGVKGVKIGHFSVDVESGSGTISRRTISPAAYGILLGAGLLYRGVGRDACGPERIETGPFPPPPARPAAPPLPWGPPPLKAGVRRRGV
ncbi:MAG: hypothetical protein IJ083_03310, partial [Clostridia bacterium]|nr:hypothetical protein [Clostridia bacterium]